MKLIKQQKLFISVLIMNFGFFAIAVLRLRGGILRIPPDPGFDLLNQAPLLLVS